MKNVPDWAYYQLNGKTFAENYVEIHRKRQEKFRLEKEVQEQIEEQVKEAVEKALDEVLGTFTRA